MVAHVEQFAGWIQLSVAVLAFAGTFLQMVSNLEQTKSTNPEGVATFNMIGGIKTEISWIRHPVQWFRRQRDVRALLKKSVGEARIYLLLRRQFWGWTTLVGAALLAVIVAALGIL